MNPGEYTRMYEVEDHHWWYAGLHRLILKTIRRETLRLGRPLTIFDAGCGTGRLCQLMTSSGHTTGGCDASEEALRLCRTRGVAGVFQADLNTLELEREAFDAITSIDVLYHSGIVDDVAVLRRLWHGLRPGGMLVLNLVAHEFLRSTHDIAVHTRERYTSATLRERLHAAGFEIEFISYRVSALFPLIALFRLMARLHHRPDAAPHDVVSDTARINPVINFLLLGILAMENSFLDYSPLPIGSSLFAIARKAPVTTEAAGPA